MASENTAVENYYDCSYQKWQLGMNKFAAKAKAPYFAPFVKSHFKCAEFGASSGNILSAIPCTQKVAIEINDCARKWGETNLGLEYVARAEELLESGSEGTFDFVFTSSVLEHVECPICEVRKIFRLLKPGGVFYCQVPGMAISSMVWKPNDVNNHLQIFGALEAGNMLVGAGFQVQEAECTTEITAWPFVDPDRFDEVVKDGGFKAFQQLAREEGERAGNRLSTTNCIGRKPSP